MESFKPHVRKMEISSFGHYVALCIFFMQRDHNKIVRHTMYCQEEDYLKTCNHVHGVTRLHVVCFTGHCILHYIDVYVISVLIHSFCIEAEDDNCNLDQKGKEQMLNDDIRHWGSIKQRHTGNK